MNQLSEEQQERLKQIRERRSRVEKADLDYATSDTGTRCIGYIYEKETGEQVAQMSSLYDVMRGQLFANAAADIDFLLSLPDSDSQAAGCADFERYWDEYQYPHLPNGVAGYEHAKRAWNAASLAMRDKCVDAIKSLRATPHGAAYNNAINDAIGKVESLTLDQVKPGLM